MVNLLITGSNGQLGNELRVISGDYPYYNFEFTDIKELDITDTAKIEEFFSRYEPDVLINCAGHTAVDNAEDEPEKAMWLNRDAVSNLASACDKYDCYMIHISTDYVFDGKGSDPYREKDVPSPASVYGLSKLAGEEMIMSCLQRGAIIRTSWLYSSFGRNFIKTILKKCQEKDELKVVSDQIGSPTYARDLARALLGILGDLLVSQQFEILHYANEGECSWYDFATEAVKIAGSPCKILPVPTSEYPTKALRPAHSVLDISLAKSRFGLNIPHWKESLKNCIGEILKDQGK
jgi:dTDP-4-dehydrorhamnose reductase